MSCHEALALFSALVDGALSPAEEGRLRAHVAGCAECTRELAAFERTVHMLRGADPARAPAGFVDRVLAAAAPVPWYRRLLRALLVPLPTKLPLEAAATVLVGVLVFTVFRHTPELNETARELPTAAAPTSAATASAPPGAEVVSGPSEQATSTTLLSRAAPRETGSTGERDARERPTAPPSTGDLRDASTSRDPGPPRQEAREVPAAPEPRATAPAPGDVERAKQAMAPESRRDPSLAQPGGSPARESAEAESSRNAPAAVPSPRPSAPPAAGSSAKLRSAAPDAAATVQKTSVAADVVGRLVVADRAATRRAVADLAARLGGSDVTAGPAGEPALVEIVIPRGAWDDLVRELARLGRFTPERQPPDLPTDVRVAIRLEQSR